MTASLTARLIAFYLPQYYPTPENDLWWGKGFTEWTNVAKAKPLFPGHKQPNLPSDLGFYDLRVPEVRQAQADLARAYGIEGFCYWHYWFGDGRRLLDRVFNEVLESGKPDFPFCLAWANEDWNRSWHGQEQELLMEQKYPGEEDYRRHFEFLLKAFRDPRYIRVDNKPLFVIYNPEDLPRSREAITFWKKLAVEAGLPGLYVPGVCDDTLSLDESGLDARIPPQPGLFQHLKVDGWHPGERPNLMVRAFRKVWNKVYPALPFPRIYSYRQKAKMYANLPRCDSRTIPCAMPNWDNTPRCGKRGVRFIRATPEMYRVVLRKSIADVTDRPPDHRLVFLKSWNEWAEGNHLEPNQRYGHEFLKVTNEEVFRRVPQMRNEMV
ncbi:MAG: glycoside hydrolase family 99-like domain-containing protein [Verrucomicrobiota bacterium]